MCRVSGSAVDSVHEHRVDPGHVMDTLHGLRSLTGHQLADLVPPLVPDVSSCLMFRREMVNLESRLEVLSHEGLAMGDDELNITPQSMCQNYAADPKSNTSTRCWLAVGFKVAPLMLFVNGWTNSPT